MIGVKYVNSEENIITAKSLKNISKNISNR